MSRLKFSQKVLKAFGFGYLVHIQTSSGNAFFHWSLKYSDALEWMNCYPADDLVWIQRCFDFRIISARVETRPAPWIVS